MSGPERYQGGDQDMGGLAGLPGLEAVREQVAGVIAVIRAERARQDAGAAVARPTWKNLVFTGGPGSGKSRAAAAVGRIYRGLGVLSSGHLIEVAIADLAGPTSRETSRLVREAAGRARGGVLMITDARAYAGQRASDQQVLRCMQEVLTERREDLVVILAGQAGQLRSLLRGAPGLASRFPASVDFPGYTAGQLAAIFASLAGEAGFTLSPAAAQAASSVLGQAHGDEAAAAPAWRSGCWSRPPPARPAGSRPPASLRRRLQCARSAPPTSPTWHICKIRSNRVARTRSGPVRICSGCRWHPVPDGSPRDCEPPLAFNQVLPLRDSPRWSVARWDMGDRWCTADGWGVEVVQMTATTDRHDGESFRVSYCGFHVGYARSVPELERWIELADLQEALGMRAADGAVLSRPSPGRAVGHTRPTCTPLLRHRIVRWPLPRAWALRAGSHRHGVHDTLE